MFRLGYTDVWSAETDGADGFTPLALAAGLDPGPAAGRGHHPGLHPGPGACWPRAWRRWPRRRPGRFTLGIGNLLRCHREPLERPMEFDEPYKRARDTIRFLRAALAGEKVDEEYETFTGSGVPAGPPGRAPAAHLPGRPPAGDAAAGRPGGRRRDHQLAVGRGRGHGHAGARSRHPGRRPHLRLPLGGRRAWCGPSAAG